MSVKKLLRIVISASLLGYLIYLVDIGDTLKRIGAINLSIVWIAALLLVCQTALSAFKWKLLLQASEIRLAFVFLFATYLKGNFVSLFLPTSFGGDVYRVIRLKQESGRFGDSASSVLFDRLTGLFALVSIAVVAYMFLPEMEHKSLLLPLYIAGIAVFLMLTSASFLRRLDAILPPRLSKLAHPLRTFRAYRQLPRTMFAVLAIAFLFQFNIVVVNKIYTLALGIDISMTFLLLIIPIIYLTEILPISINGIGVRDSAFVFFFVYLGYSAEEGLAVAFLVLIFRYLVGSIGGLVFLAESLGGPPGHKTLQEAAEAGSDSDSPHGRR